MAYGAVLTPKTPATPGTPAPDNSLSRYNTNFSTLYPNLSATQAQVSGNTLARLRGELSPETLNTIQDEAARFGVRSGMPGSGISGTRGVRNLGLTAEGQQSQGLADYLNTLKTYSGTLMPTTGEQIGAETAITTANIGAEASKYSANKSAETAANALAQQAAQFSLTFPESQRQFDSGFGENQRQFDVSHTLQNNQFYAGLENNYLNSYLQFLN